MNSEDVVLATEVQLLLAEKRTSLAVMRTALAMLAVPLSIVSVLIATSRYYDVSDVSPLLIPVLGLSVALAAIACYLIIRSLRHMHDAERKIDEIKRASQSIADIVVE